MALVTRRLTLHGCIAGACLLALPGVVLHAIETVRLPGEAANFTPVFAEPVLRKIRGLAEHPGKKIRIGFPTLSGDEKSITLSYKRTQRTGVPYAVLESEGRKPLYLTHNGTARLHEIDFTSRDADMMDRLKKRTGILWSRLKEWMREQDSFTLAIKAVAAAVAVWLAAGIGSTVLAGIAFVASYALVIGLIIAGVLVIAELFPGLYLVQPRQERVTQVYMKKTQRFSDVVSAVAA